MSKQKQHDEETRQIRAAIYAVQTDINSPQGIAASIITMETQIAALQERLAQAKERQAQLPLILEQLQAKLAKHLENKPTISSTLDKIQKLQQEIAKLKGDNHGNETIRN